MKRSSFLLALPLAALFLLGIAANPAHAEVSKKVTAAFKGKLLVTNGPLAEGGANDKETIALFKKASLTEVVGAVNGSDVHEWLFNYTGFLKSAGATTLKLEFYDGTRYVADQTLTGQDPKLTVVAGEVQITEDDGLTKGKVYTLKLVATVKGKDVVLAQSQKIAFK